MEATVAPKPSKKQREVMLMLRAGKMLCFSNEGQGLGYYLRESANPEKRAMATKLTNDCVARLIGRGWIEQIGGLIGMYILETYGLTDEGKRILGPGGER